VSSQSPSDINSLTTQSVVFPRIVSRAERRRTFEALQEYDMTADRAMREIWGIVARTALQMITSSSSGSRPQAVSHDGWRIFCAQGIQRPESNVIHVKIGAVR
jgi:hypothetical protein